MKVEFVRFGLNNPTIVKFHVSDDECITLEVKGHSVEMVCEKIEKMLRMLGRLKARYVTSFENYRRINQRAIPSVQSVNECFRENGIYIMAEGTVQSD
jgi:hypothetical protein